MTKEHLVTNYTPADQL